MGDFRPRTVWLGHPEKREQRYPKNVINNQKYNFFTFLPGVSVSQRSSIHLPPLPIRSSDVLKLMTDIAVEQIIHSEWQLVVIFSALAFSNTSDNYLVYIQYDQ